MASNALPDAADAAAPLVLLGAGGHGRVALDVCRAAKLAVAGFIAVGNQDAIDGVPVLGDDTLLSDKAFLAAHLFLPALGIQAVKRRLSEALLAAGGRLVTAIHPAATVSPTARIGVGTLVVAGSVINTGARIGKFCIVNTMAGIDHDCVLDDGAQIGSGAILCGAVHCGIDTLIGAGAVILPGRRVGAHAVVGAGAVVTHDVADGATVIGNPARRL